MHHIAGPPGSFAASERERGWRETLAATGAPVPAVVRGDWTAPSGHAAAAQLADATAIFSANDQMALGALRALSEAGRRVPGHVEVIGFDDVPDAAEYLPPLTTIRQDFAALAEAAVDALVADLDAPLEAGSTIIPTVLVERSSTRALK